MTESRFPAKTALDPIGRRYDWVPNWLLDLLDLYVNRDGCRTPMQLDSSANAGFCPRGAAPWLPVPDSYQTINVEVQSAADDSLLNLYKSLLNLRRDYPALQAGTIHLLEEAETERDLLGFRRGEDILVLINFGDTTTTFRNRSGCGQVLLKVGMEELPDPELVRLPPYSGVVLSN